MSNNLPSQNSALLVRADQEFDSNYFDENPTSYSSRIYRKLASNPAMSGLGGRPLGNREKLIIAATVLSASDEKIAELERSGRASARVISLLNAPLFGRSAPQIHASDNSVNEVQDPATKAETAWFQRYLTLRNLLAAVVIVCGGIAGVMAWTTSNFKDRAEGAEKREEAARTDTAYWKTQRDNYFVQVQSVSGERDRAVQEFVDYKKNLETQQKAAKPLQSQLEDAQKTIKTLQTQLENAQKTVSTRDKTIATLQQSVTK